MASALNKRQQARNERTLQELIKTVPGNEKCADCGARNPGWASWSLGIFLCMRCAALHRKLGTHISKVKSLSMDKWDNAQVDNMKRIGNIESNKTFNPRNVKPQIPIDVDEVDSVMERFIRQKYEQRAFINDSRPGTRQNTGSTSSVEDRPPPLPPKPTKRFGFGLQKSSTFPRNVTPPVSPGLGGFGQDTSPPRVNKPSRVFGSNINTSGDSMESKLQTLRDMGFTDDKRNATVLKALNGNVDRTVEALIRLGEQTTRGNTPTPPAKPSVNGISIDRTRTTPAATTSTNPFDALDAVAPIPQQPPQQAPIQTQQLPYNGAAYSQTISPPNPYNPFLPPAQQASFAQQQQHPFSQQQQQHFTQQQQQHFTQQQQQHFTQQQQQHFTQQQQSFPQQQQSLEQSFQGLNLSNQQPQQPLFPNRTGGYGQPQTPQYPQTNPFQHSFTPPPMPQMPQQYSSFYAPQQPQYQSLASPSGTSNPFLKSAKSQIFSTSNSNPFGQPQPHQASVSPFMMSSQTPPVSIATAQNPWQNQQQQPQTAPAAPNPNPWQNSQPTYQQPVAQPSFDKNSILALYNYPQLAPQRSEPAQTAPSAATAAVSPPAQAPGSMNPFAASGSSGARQGVQAGAGPVAQGGTMGGGLTGGLAQNQETRHVSNESVDFAGLMGGRHSPDAFSGLSANFRR